MRVLVTGAAGFIGSTVSEHLLTRGDEVVGLDNFNTYYDPVIKKGNIEDVQRVAERSKRKFTMIECDLLDSDAVSSIFECADTKPDVVCHLAAWAGVRPSIQDPLRYSETNVDGTTRLLLQCREHNVLPFVFASSSSVYGARTEVPFSEDDRVDDPISPYAATKKAGELIGYTFHHLHQIRFVGLRFFTVYGPRQRPEMAIHLFARKILRGEPITVFGNGSSARDYTYIDDTVDGVLAAIDRAANKDGYRIYNLGCGQTTRLSGLIESLEDAIGKKAIIQRMPDQPGDVPQTFACIERAKAELNYNPKTPPSIGLPRFVDWLRTKGLTS